MSKQINRPKDLLGLEALSKTQIEEILEQAKPMKQLFTRSVKKAPALRGRTIALVFLNPPPAPGHLLNWRPNVYLRMLLILLPVPARFKKENL